METQPVFIVMQVLRDLKMPTGEELAITFPSRDGKVVKPLGVMLVYETRVQAETDWPNAVVLSSTMTPLEAK